MKLMKITTMTILILVLTVTLVRAEHVPQVLLNPSEWSANTEKDLYFSVKNTEGDNIVKVELTVPETSDEKPVYIIKEIGEPAGWTYETRRKYGQTYPYKIIWTTSSSGIGIGETVEFGFTAVSPESGEYEWEWKTIDTKGDSFSGISTTKVSAAPVAYFKIFGVPEKVMAGSLLKITVKAYGEDNNLKTDYTGTISFTSTDTKAILPKDYTFDVSDEGSKDFYITYKTVGNHTFTVTDWSAKITQKSIVTKVNPGTPTSITITPEDSEVSPGDSIEFKAIGKDKFDNEFDVTEMVKWSIDKEAGGSWEENIYTAENEGIWTVTGSYNSLIDGTSLTVKTGAVPPAEKVPEEVPKEVPEEVPEEIPPVTPTAPLEEINIEVQESVDITPGSNETFVATVNNVGTVNLTDVSLSTMGVPSDWVVIYPPKADIEAGTSKEFLVILSIPENETGSKKMDLIAVSKEGITTSTTIDVNLVTGPTGLVGISKNLLNLGIVIIAVAALVLIAWELWFRKPR